MRNEGGSASHRQSTEVMELSIQDLVTRDLGYDSDLIIDEKDRMKLMSMAEM